jgi:hypothetical protein
MIHPMIVTHWLHKHTTLPVRTGARLMETILRGLHQFRATEARQSGRLMGYLRTDNASLMFFRQLIV